MAILQKIKEKQIYLDETLPKVSALRIEISNIRFNESVTFIVEKCLLSEAGAPQPIIRDQLIFDGDNYKNWIDDNEILDYVCEKYKCEKVDQKENETFLEKVKAFFTS